MTRYLAVSAHPDDVEVGCGATLFSLLRPSDQLYYVVMTKCLDIRRNKNILEEWRQVVQYLKRELPCKVQAKIHDFPNRRLFEKHMEIRSILDKIRDSYKPDIVFSCSPKDLHQDHSYIGTEVRRVFRECSMLTYELPRSVGDFAPLHYQVLSEQDVRKAFELLLLYVSQSQMGYMSEDMLEGILKHRGGEIGRKYAQAFEVIRLVNLR